MLSRKEKEIREFVSESRTIVSANNNDNDVRSDFESRTDSTVVIGDCRPEQAMTPSLRKCRGPHLCIRSSPVE